MGRMQFITGFVAWFPDSGDGGQAELARVGGLVSATNWQWLRQTPYLLAVNPSASITPAESADMLLDVFPGTAASARLAAANFNDAQLPEDVHRKAETCAQCYNLLQATEDAFLLESDALGLKPVYTARTSGGNVLASRVADILRLFPELAEPVDTAALYEQLGFWVPLAGRTLHRRIRRTLPGGRYRWAPAAGFSGERGRDLGPTTVKPQWFMDQAIEAIHDTTRQSLREKPRECRVRYCWRFPADSIRASSRHCAATSRSRCAPCPTVAAITAKRKAAEASRGRLESICSCCPNSWTLPCVTCRSIWMSRREWQIPERHPS